MSFFHLFNFINDILDPYSAWLHNEIQQFEEGLREYGKNFFKISAFKVTTFVINK